jgi:hypothetical protein
MQTEQNASTEVENVTPTPSTEQAQQPAAVSTEPGAEQTAEQIEQQTQQDKPKNDWVQRRIDQLTREKHEERRQREELEARLRQYQQPADGQQQPQQRQMSADDIRAEARRLVEQDKFNDACNKVFDAGKTEFAGDWDSSLRTFQMLGGASPEFLEAVTAMDGGHKVLHHLGQNPELAERVLSLPPLRMALELARLETTVGQAKPKPVSKAPDPINPIGGRSAPVEPPEFATTAEQIAWWKKHGS